MSSRNQLTRQTSWRDSYEAFTEKELIYLRDVVYPSIPSFDGASIASNDLPLCFEKCKWPRSAEVNKAYQGFWERNYNGRVPRDYLLNLVAKFHNVPEWLRLCTIYADLDNDGFISEDEFKELLRMLSEHDPSWRWKGKTFEDFIKEADVNQDGKVTIDECVNWAGKYLDQ